MASRPNVALTVILSEICYLYPFYYLLAKGFGIFPALSLWSFPFIAIVFTLVNIILARGNYRNIFLVGINLLFFILLLALVSGKGLVMEKYNVSDILTYLFISWVCLRVNFLVRSKNIDFYTHFDASLVLVFLAYLIAGFAKVALPGGMLWLISSFFFNIAKVYLAQIKKETQTFSWGILLIFFILISLSFTADSVLPFLTKPAQFLYDLGSPVFITLGRIILFLLISFFQITHMAPKHDYPTLSFLANDVSSSEIYRNPGESGAMFFILSWIFIIIGTGIALGLLFYILRSLLSWLFKIQKGTAEAGVSENYLLLIGRTLISIFLLFINRIYILTLPWLPVKLSVKEAYKALLRWGAFRKYPRRLHETPYEYFQRLIKRFPQYQQELQLITDDYVVYQYGKDSLSLHSNKELKIHLRKLYIPRLLRQNT